jgi:hypothetical protein
VNSVRPRHPSLRRRLAAPAVAWVAAALAAQAAAAAGGLPDLQRGDWQVRRTVEGKTIEERKCSSPSDELQSEIRVLANAGCKISPVRRSGDRYTFRSDCELKTRSGRLLKSDRSSELTVDRGTSYRLRVRGTTNGRPIAETVVGTRVGDCKQ